jgi:hypothetical protein
MSFVLLDGNNAARRAFTEGSAGVAIRKLLSTRGTWIWDGVGGVNLRRKVYPAYKVQRTPAVDSFYSMLTLVKELLHHSGAVQVEVPNYEADDVIATLAQELSAKQHKCFIRSNDGDFQQLCVNPLITCEASAKRPADLVRLYKTCVGDSSDNISGIPGFGPKTWDKVSKPLLADVVADQIAGGSHPRLRELELPAKVLDFLHTEGTGQLRTLWEIVGFYPVPSALIDKHTRVGLADLPLVHSIMQKYMMEV